MKRLLSRGAIAALPLVLALGAGASAQTPETPPAPALKAAVTVTSDIVRIGDLVANAGLVADVPIFRAPDLGTTGAVATDRIVQAISAHQLIGIDTGGLAEVVVTRASRAITVQEISADVARALAGQFGFGDAHNIQVNFDRDVRTLQVEPNITGPLQVMALAYDPRTTRFDITFGLPQSVELRRQPARYTGTAIATVDAIAVDHPIGQGEVIKASDITVMRRPRTDTGMLTDTAAVVGMAARHALHPGQPLGPTDVMKPELVQRNDTVTMTYQAPGVTLTLRGQAKDGGALGDTITVINLESKRTVQAVVFGQDRVAVGPVSNPIAANATASAE